MINYFNEVLTGLGISKVKLAKYLGVSRQMLYNYLSLDSLEDWPEDKKIKIKNLLGIEDGMQLSDITIGTSYKFTMVNRRMVICLPSEYSLVSILDQNRFDMINSFSNVGNFVIRINNENITYKYYISNPTTQTDFKVNFRINK